MAFFNFLSGLVKRKKNAGAESPAVTVLSTTTATETLSVVSDLSLRANGETYLDRDGEADQIFNRIQSNSSSVIGIGGVRGAGKSSLALKVLKMCVTEKYFTILIPSPTAYDSKEFLLTLYQCICEQVKSDLEVSLQKQVTIAQQTEKEIGNNNIIMRLGRLVLTFLIFLTLIGVANYFFINYSILNLGRISYHTETISNNYPSNFRNVPGKSNIVSDTSSKSSTHLQSKPIDSLYGDTSTLHSRYKPMGIDSSFFSGRINRIKDLQGQLKFPAIFNPFIFVEYFRPANSYFTSLYAPCIYLFIVYFIFLLFKRGAKNLKAKNLFLKLHSIENGLFKLTVGKLEWLVYQVKLSNSTELSAPISKFTAKLSKQKSLETRPLSLPGITSDFNTYIQNVSLYKKKIVVCIDELDKIGDPAELNLLLKGIKGIIGQNKTHFILTVSEDALAKFSTRFRQERDLLESSFEEIYILNKVSFNLASSIIINTYYSKPKNDATVDFEVNRMLVWIFGNAIPREIKRTMIILSNAKMDLAYSAKFDIWRKLMLASISSLRSWALINNDDEFLTYDFLICLEQIEDTLPQKTFSITEGLAWFSSLLTYFSKYYENRVSGDNLTKPLVADSPVIAEISDFEKAVFEISLLSLSLLLVANDSTDFEQVSNRIQAIFELLPYSYLLSVNELHKYLKELGIDIT